MKKILIIYDCPFKECDKLWVYNELKKYTDVKVIDIIPKTTYLKLSKKFQKIKLGKIILRFVALFQCIRAIISSKKDDIIVVWNYFGGVFFNQVLKVIRIKRKIVSFCWIELPKKKNYKKIKNCLVNDNFIPIINDKNLENSFIKLFDLQRWNGIMLPDVYDDNERFIEPVFNKNNKYCFAGGFNNRDWKLLIKVAEQIPNLDFIIVTDKNAIKDNIPNNVILYENIEKKQYYNLMKNAFITICPLKENRVSGLINIIKSIQYGIPCITTDFSVTSMYYDNHSKSLLLYNNNDYNDLKDKINNFLNINNTQYIKIVNDLQLYMKKEFNPQNNIKKLVNELKNRNWL